MFSLSGKTARELVSPSRNAPRCQRTSRPPLPGYAACRSTCSSGGYLVSKPAPLAEAKGPMTYQGPRVATAEAAAREAA